VEDAGFKTGGRADIIFNILPDICEHIPGYLPEIPQ
jgi:hypothetical protein